ncbi:hypothetical protein DL764_009630 [Monosporascus ibericus]|uniref:DNA-directed RNA polymerase III subunit RPC9 n=1 Tax=Monosporascus ibericus TaxID=155417 RepID=A0A4V1X8X5_9PEZI|nr:hypothetical protein DL764_009630 [Monosporascus ibericus]
MKVLESQNAVLTNLEVYGFLSAQAKEYQEQKRRGPGNLEILRKEVLQYFEAFPSPLSQKPPPFDAAAIPALLQRLRAYQITKGEFAMIFNMRPTNIPTLNAVIEDMEERFTQDEQEDIVNGIAEVLGSFPPPPEEDGEGDAMQTTE